MLESETFVSLKSVLKGCSKITPYLIIRNNKTMHACGVCPRNVFVSRVSGCVSQLYSLS